MYVFLQTLTLVFLLENGQSGSETASGISDGDVDLETSSSMPERTATLLDLYSGCGGMSTGLCLGAALSGLKLETVIFYLFICWIECVHGLSTNSIVLAMICSDGLLILTVLRAKV